MVVDGLDGGELGAAAASWPEPGGRAGARASDGRARYRAISGIVGDREYDSVRKKERESYVA